MPKSLASMAFLSKPGVNLRESYIFLVILMLSFVGGMADENVINPQGAPRKRPVWGGRVIYWKLAVQWPNSYCNQMNHDCYEEVPQRFTIPGLWPIYRNGLYCKGELAHCKPKLTPADLQHMEEELETQWPQLRRNHEDFLLWNRQWEKHGCLFRSVGPKPREYFFKALKFKRIIDRYYRGGILKRQMKSKGIAAHPKEWQIRYYTDGFCDASTEVVRPDMSCNEDRESNSQFYEFYFCFTDLGEMFPCSKGNSCLKINCSDKSRFPQRPM